MGLKLSKIMQAIAAGGGGAGAAMTLNAITGNRSKFPTATASIATGVCSSRIHYTRSEGACTDHVFHHSFWYIGASHTLQLPAGTYEVGMFLEYPSGTFTRVTFDGGALTKVMSTSTRLIKTDPCPVEIPANTAFWEHTFNAGAGNATIATQVHPATAAALGVNDMKYTMSAFTPAHQSGSEAATATFGSFMITGTVLAGGVRSPFLVGDSLPYGAGDITGVGSKGGNGYPARALDLAGVGYAIFANPSMAASNLASLINASNATIDAWLDVMRIHATDLLCQYGVNDFRIGQTAEQYRTSLQTIYAEFPLATIHQFAITPRVTTTDSYATVANQTPQTDGTWSLVPAMNTEILAGGIANVDHVIDVTLASSPTGVPDKWTAPPAATTDGVHPTTTKAAAMAVIVEPLLVL